MDLIKNDISASWNSVGMALKISMNDRDTLRRDSGLTATEKLEQILNKWIQSESMPVTWRTLIVKDYLEKPENYKKYM